MGAEFGRLLAGHLRRAGAYRRSRAILLNRARAAVPIEPAQRLGRERDRPHAILPVEVAVTRVHERPVTRFETHPPGRAERRRRRVQPAIATYPSLGYVDLQDPRSTVELAYLVVEQIERVGPRGAEWRALTD